MNSNNINNRRKTFLPGSYSESLSPAMAINEVVPKNSRSWPHPHSQVPSWLLQKNLTLSWLKPGQQETKILFGKSKGGTSTAKRQELLRFKQALSEGSCLEPSWDDSAISQLCLMKKQLGFTGSFCSFFVLVPTQAFPLRGWS